MPLKKLRAINTPASLQTSITAYITAEHGILVVLPFMALVYEFKSAGTGFALLQTLRSTWRARTSTVVFLDDAIINNGGEVSISTAGPQYPRLIAYYGNGNICLNRPLFPGDWTHFLHGLVIVQRYVRRRSINRQFDKIITAQLRSIMVFNPLLLKTFMSGALHSHGWRCGLPWEIIEMIARLCINGRLERGQDLPVRRIQTKKFKELLRVEEKLLIPA